jgi:peptidoglycan/LPS O-acetylase OafA/YrhL
LFIADVLIGFLDFPYSPPPVQFALTIIGVGVLVVVGKYLPSYSHQLTQSKAARPFKFLIVGALGTIIFFLLSWLAPSTGIPAALNILAIIVWTSLVGALVLRLSGYGRSWRERHLVSLISGGLSFFVFLDFILELNTSGAKDYTGQAFVGIACVGFLVWLYKATGKREMTSALEPQSSLVIH